MSNWNQYGLRQLMSYCKCSRVITAVVITVVIKSHISKHGPLLNVGNDANDDDYDYNYIEESNLPV